MRVDLDDEVVDGSREPLRILGILAMGAEGRHRVLADRHAAQAWLDSLPPDLRDEAELALDLGEEDEVLGVDLCSVRVVGPDNVDAISLELDPTSALSLLTRPLAVVLENGDNDGAFLLAFAPAPLRARLVAAREAGWLLFWNGGGISGCQTWASQLSSMGALATRTYISADSDAKTPNQPSAQANRLHQTLTNEEQNREWPTGQCGRVLARRSIENYVPGVAFADWWADNKSIDLVRANTILSGGEPADVPSDRQDAIRIWLAAKTLDACPVDVKNHMDVADGRYRGTGHTVRTDGAVWNLLNPWQQAVLQEGLIKQNVRDFYRQARDLTPIPSDVHEILTTIRRAL